MYKYSAEIHFLHALTVSNLSDYWMSNETYMWRETCVTIQRTSEVEEVFQYYFGICPQHQKLTSINTCSWSMVFVWSWRKNFSFHVTRNERYVLTNSSLHVHGLRNNLKWLQPLLNMFVFDPTYAHFFGNCGS